MAFIFKEEQSLYYPKEEGGILKVKELSISLEELHAYWKPSYDLVDSPRFSPELCWFEMNDIGDGENHSLKIAEKSLHLDSSILSLSNGNLVKFTIEVI